MTNCIIINNEMHHKMAGIKNRKENLKEINIDLKENERKGKTYEDSKEEEEGFIYQKEINIIKIYYDKNAYQNIKKNLSNNLLEFQSYYKIKFKKLYLLLNLIVFFINTSSFLNECRQKKLLSKLSEVTLNISGKGNIKLFSDNFFQRYNHCEIYSINDTILDINKNEY